MCYCRREELLLRKAGEGGGEGGAHHREGVVDERTDAKVGDFGLTLEIDEDVGGFDVAVDLKGGQEDRSDRSLAGAKGGGGGG